MTKLELFQEPFKIPQLFSKKVRDDIRTYAKNISNEMSHRTVFTFSKENVKKIISPVLREVIEDWDKFEIIRSDYIHIKEPFGLHWDAFYGSRPADYAQTWESATHLRNPWKTLFICMDDDIEESEFNGTVFMKQRSFVPWDVDWTKEFIFDDETAQYFRPGYPNMKMYDINQNRIGIPDKMLITEHELVTRFRHIEDVWLNGLEVEKYIPWQTGDVFFNDTIQIHCGANWGGGSGFGADFSDIEIKSKNTLRGHFRDPDYDHRKVFKDDYEVDEEGKTKLLDESQLELQEEAGTKNAEKHVVYMSGNDTAAKTFSLGLLKLEEHKKNDHGIKVLITGLPGSGKTTLAKELSYHFNIPHYNADVIREFTNNYAHDKRGITKQFEIMKKFHFGILDFVCPYDKFRNLLHADIVIWMDTIQESEYEDTNKIFEEPVKYNYRIKEWIGQEELRNSLEGFNPGIMAIQNYLSEHFGKLVK